jgi:hypothetical protein
MKAKKNILTIKKKENEVDLFFNIRKIFVNSFKPKNIKENKLYEMYSNIFIYMIFYKCRYNDKTEKIIKKFLLKNKNMVNIKQYINQ